MKTKFGSSGRASPAPARGAGAVSRWLSAGALGVAAALGGPCGPARLAAQVTTPGPLSVAHADWDGPADCARCHERDRRTTATRCLACHEPLAERIADGRGYHADRDDGCASCHREHEGRGARPVRFEPAGFDHATIGYRLEGDHADLACSGCHNTRGVRDREVRLFKGRYGALSRTYLGLEGACTSCHAASDPHAGQFDARGCADCHGESRWAPATRFDHAATRYALTGRHRSADCSRCHLERDATVAYRPLDFGSCASCHRDPHAGEMGTGCADCHRTAGWRRIARSRFEGDFDHGATAFPLGGRHAAASCDACHRPRPASDAAIALTFPAGGLPSYPRPRFDDCASCHLDYHEGELADSTTGTECGACHTEWGWAPTTFEVFRHDRTAFPLEGAHRVTPCEACHATGTGGRPPFRLRLEASRCVDCHADADPHGDQFAGRPCADCHGTRSFAIDAFDHGRTRFPLEGEHASVPCAGCHQPEPAGEGARRVRYQPVDTACRTCHGVGPSGQGMRP